MFASLSEIATLVNGVVIGDEKITVTAISPIDDITEGSLVFADGTENIKRAVSSKASVILVAEHVNDLPKPVIKVSNPLLAFITLLNHYYPPIKAQVGIHSTAVIAEDVTLGNQVSIGPFVVIESGSVIGDNVVIKSHVHVGHMVTIGKDSVIHPQVTIYDHCQIGQRVQIHASTVIGSDGFGYKFIDGQHAKLPHVGRVVIENDVEIGSNTSVDRATLGATIIGEGTKIDNLVQIAHSVKLGKHNILCGFTGIAGSTTSGSHVIFAAGVGVADHVKIDDGVILGARAGVAPNKHLKQGNVYLGFPARPRDKSIEREFATARIPIIHKNIKALTAKVDQLAELIANQENI